MRYQSTTGLPKTTILEIVARIHEVMTARGMSYHGYRFGLYKQVEITLLLLRQNMSQMVAADMHGISQPTISRIYRRTCALLESVLVFTDISLTEAIDQDHLILVDGTFVPTGNRPASGQGSANYSGKRKVQCLSIQIASTASGELIAVSDPVPGARHDAKALELCGWAKILNHDAVNWIADSAYVGTSAITPIKKAPGRERLEWEKEFNRTIAGLRAPVEHCIAHMKNWKILSKGYRGRLAELPGIIRIVTQLELLRTGW